jgi:hypothetical protein
MFAMSFVNNCFVKTSQLKRVVLFLLLPGLMFFAASLLIAQKRENVQDRLFTMPGWPMNGEKRCLQK